MARPVWHVLDVGSIWMKEFASALSQTEDVVAWCPRMERFGLLQRGWKMEELASPPLRIRHFPLQRGYARAPLRWLAPYEGRQLRRMRAAGRESAGADGTSVLVCSTPFYAPLAERWAGPVVYYSTDLTHAYDGLDAALVKSLDARMCRVATAVCPNSRRIAQYFTSESGCDAAKITIVPNATRASNLMREPPGTSAGELPEDLADVLRPIAGVLGDLSANMDWVLTRQAMERTPELNWVFVGPTTRAIEDPEQDAARRWAMERARFTGAKPYGELQRYARSFDVAVLPYRRKEPTYSGSSTRFYEHLAACRPMVATRGFAELLEKVPLVCLADTPEEMVQALQELRKRGFSDGCEQRRWEASLTGTWEERARMMTAAVEAGLKMGAPAAVAVDRGFMRKERRETTS